MLEATSGSFAVWATYCSPDAARPIEVDARFAGSGPFSPPDTSECWAYSNGSDFEGKRYAVTVKRLSSTRYSASVGAQDDDLEAWFLRQLEKSDEWRELMQKRGLSGKIGQLAYKLRHRRKDYAIKA
jgi:hypothetical protein